MRPIFLERTYFKGLEERDGRCLVLGVPHVKDLNKLQVLQSYRQVYCPSDDFRFAEEVAAEHPEACSLERGRVQIAEWEWHAVHGSRQSSEPAARKKTSAREKPRRKGGKK